jgi:hypothetical protein
MAAKKKNKKEDIAAEEEVAVVEDAVAVEEPAPVQEEAKEKPTTKQEKEPKYKIGSIVFVSKDVEADLNGFTLFPPYKNSIYTVEAYDGNTGIYSLRSQKLLISLKEVDIVAPHEKEDSSLFRKQF